MKTELLIVGGGCGGVAAGLQAARMGIDVIIVEPSAWLGGMITAAGVSAFDGNKYGLGGGIFGELRKKIEDYYGGADTTFTGWISLTCFEPKIAKDFLHDMAGKEQHLTVFLDSSVKSVLLTGERISGAVFTDESGNEFRVEAELTIDATEYGDLIAAAELPYMFGRESKSESGEPHAAKEHDFLLQDLTYCAILKKYDGNAPQVPASDEYDENNFINSTALHSSSTDENFLNHKLHDWESFISYAALPNDKYLLNWPHRANDYPAYAEIYEQPQTREQHFQRAKQLTLDYIHYIQTTLGHPEWGLADDEFQTEDKLPLIPYVRESRRMLGVTVMREDDVIPVDNSYRPPFKADSIAVGDYFLDHHHSQAFLPPENRLVEQYPDNAPFQIPAGVLIPLEHEGILAAEKNISVTHIVNGCTRLQPVVMLTGQAAGALAALAIQSKKEPRYVDGKELRNVLINAKCQLFPYKDMPPEHPAFEAAQRFAMEGIFIDNKEFTFEPDVIVSDDQLSELLDRLHITDSDKPALHQSLSEKKRWEIFLSLQEFL